jgi:DNA polymerase-3 subunit gamma/tau
MRDWMRVIELAPGRLVFSLAPGLDEDPSPELRDALLRATGERWQVERREAEGVPTLREQAEAERVSARERIRSNPLVEAAFAAFPASELVDDDEGAGGNRNWSKRA